MKKPVAVFIGILLVFRAAMLLALPLNGIIGFGDLGNFFRLAEIPGWPYFHYWSEYPPVFPFLSKLLFLAAGGSETKFTSGLYIVLTLADSLNLFLFHKISERLWAGKSAWVRTGGLLFIMLAVPYSWWYFEPLVMTTLLLGFWFLLEDKPAGSGLWVGIGILVKTFPALLIPLALKKLGWKRGLICAGIALGLATLTYGSLWLASPEFTTASLQSQGMKGSWETVWAILDGNTQTGMIGPMVERLDPVKAIQTSRNPAVVSPLISLILFGGMGLLVFIKSRLDNPLRQTAFLLFTMGVFFLWSPGWSVQWVLYLLPLILLVFPTRTAFLLAGMMVVANLLEWPVIYQVNAEYVPLTIILRTILLMLMTWMAFQVVSGKLAGGSLYTSGRRSENIGR